MRFNLLYLATKQLRFSQWIYEKIFNLGTDLHALKNYHKTDPSVVEIIAKQNGGKIDSVIVEKLRYHGHEVPDYLIEKPEPIIWDEVNIKKDLENRFKVILEESKKSHIGEK